MLEVEEVTDLPRFELTGSLVTLFTSARGARLTVIAGDYAPVSSFAVHEAGFLPLTPTCREILVDVPDGAGEITFNHHPLNAIPAECVGGRCSDRGGVQLVRVNAAPARIPQAAAPGRQALVVSASGERIELQGDWSGTPGQIVTLRATEIEFDWRGSCLYRPCRPTLPRGDEAAGATCRSACPSVSLPAVGIRAGGDITKSGTAVAGTCGVRLIDEVAIGGDKPYHACRYVCRAPPGSRGFVLPVTAEFAVGEHRDAWSAPLVRAGQLFTEFADRTNRQFRVTGVQEIRRDESDRGYRVDQASLAASDGTEFWIHIDSHDQTARVADTTSAGTGLALASGSERVSVPGATCHDRLSVRYFGRYQSFNLAPVSLGDGGEFEMPDPSESLKRHWISARIRPIFGTRFDDSSFSAGGEFEAVYQHRRPGASLGSLDVALAYQLFSGGYHPIGFSEAVASRPDMALNRTVARLRLGLHPFEEFRLHVGPGLWVRWPVKERGYALGGLAAGTEISVGAEYWLHRFVSLQGGVSSFLPEPVRKIEASRDSSATFSTHWGPSVFAGAGLGFWMAP